MSAIHVERVEKIKELAQQKGGLITTSQIEGVGISRALIPTFIEDGTLVKEGRGIYYYADELPDELKVIQTNNPTLRDIEKIEEALDDHGLPLRVDNYGGSDVWTYDDKTTLKV